MRPPLRYGRREGGCAVACLALFPVFTSLADAQEANSDPESEAKKGQVFDGTLIQGGVYEGTDGMTDTISHEHSKKYVHVNLQTGAGDGDDDSPSFGDHYQNIENIIGSRYGDTLTGNDQDNRIEGREGWDDLYGGAGDDELQGEEGNDKLNGEEGNDTLLGGLGDDRLEGGDGDDVLRYVFGSGSDYPLGGSGDDNFIFDVDKDRPDVSRDMDNVALVDGGDGHDTLTFVQFIWPDSGSLIFNFRIDSDLTDNEGKIRNIEGIRIDGNDIYFIFLVENMDFTKLSLGIAFDPNDPSDDDRHTDYPSFAARGTAGSNMIRGIGKIDGGAGDDVLEGNVLFGGSGDDIVVGRKYGDILTGGPGTDVLSGRGGKDEFHFSRGDGEDRVTDLAVGEVLVFYDLDPSSLRHISGDHGYEIRYGEGDVVTFDGVETLKYKEITVGDIRGENPPWSDFEKPYFDEYQVPPNRSFLNDSDFNIVNDHEVEDTLLMITVVNNK